MQVDIINWLGSVSLDLLLVTSVTTFLICLAIFVMHFLMPRAVLEKYFKPPFFGELERMMFTGIPYAPMRTIMFIRAIANPKSGKTRGIINAHQLVPDWYRVSSKILMVLIYVNSVLVFMMILGAGLFYFLD
jgi:hypothetical protein